MNTMGHRDLRLVRPQADHLSGVARAFGHGSEPILETASVYNALDDALSDIDLACATTARHRLQKHHYLAARDLPAALQQKGESLQRVAIVFGSERSGLSNEDVSRCDILTTIPQVSLQPSLNLSQAVMIYSFILAEQQIRVQIKDQRLNSETMPVEQYDRLKTSLVKTLAAVGLNDRYQGYVVSAIARLTYEDLYLIQTIRTYVDNKLNQLKKTTKK